MGEIEGGYYIKARKIQQSDIAKAPPYVREIWDWLLMNANHQDNHICNRGEQIRQLSDIADGLSWQVGWRKEKYTKWQCENAMKFLRDRSMITTMKTTRGLRINIVQYSFYQDSSNYESNRKQTMKATDCKQTASTINKNDKNDKKKECNKELDAQQLKKLQIQFPTKSVIQEYEKCKDFIASSGKTYKDYEAMFRNWLRRSPDTRTPPPPKNTIEFNQENIDLIQKGKLCIN